MGRRSTRLHRSCLFVGLLLIGASALGRTHTVLEPGSVLNAAEQAKKTTLDPVYTLEQARRGQAAYRKACGPCHQDNLDGGEEGAPPLAGPLFFAQWRGRTVGEIFRFMSGSMPKNAAPLPAGDYVDILSFLLWFNDMPDGHSPLPGAAEQLDQIVITNKRDN